MLSRIIPQKSSILFGGVRDAHRQAILAESGFREGIFPFTYLRVPLSPHLLLASQFAPLLNVLELTVQGWIGKHLSYAGRLEILRSVLYGKVHFWLNIFLMPEVVLHKITSICWNFLWTRDTRRYGSALIAWKFLCCLKRKKVLVSLILELAIEASLLSSFGIFILKRIRFGFIGCITVICAIMSFGLFNSISSPPHCGNPSFLFGILFPSIVAVPAQVFS